MPGQGERCSQGGQGGKAGLAVSDMRTARGRWAGAPEAIRSLDTPLSNGLNFPVRELRMPRGRGDWTETAALSSAGLTIVIATVIGYFAGHWLDGRLHTEPWLAVVGLLLGSAGGFVQLFRLMDTSSRRRNDGRHD